MLLLLLPLLQGVILNRLLIRSVGLTSSRARIMCLPRRPVNENKLPVTKLSQQKKTCFTFALSLSLSHEPALSRSFCGPQAAVAPVNVAEFAFHAAASLYVALVVVVVAFVVSLTYCQVTYPIFSKRKVNTLD